MSVVAICSGKGSPGATFVAVNLAAALASRERTVLLDLDPAGGDVAAYLGLDPRRGAYPLLQMNSSVQDSATLMNEAEERAGFSALCGFPDPCEGATVWRLSDLLRIARKSDHLVLADIGRVTDKTTVLAAGADTLILVVRPDLVSVAGAERALRLLKVRDFPIDRVKAVVSGLERRRPGDVAEVASALGIPVIGAVPLDRSAARKALTAQAPKPRGPLARAFQKLATTLTSGSGTAAEITPATAEAAK